jgi:ribonuclease HI
VEVDVKMKYIIATDGGAFKRDDSGFDSVSAFRMYENGKLVFQEALLLENKTNNYAEIYAIFRGLKAISTYIRRAGIQKAEVMLITDSELCFKSLTVWMRDWLDKSDGITLMNSSKKPVINQEVVKMAYINMLELQSVCKFKMCHINSHESVDNIDKLKKKFTKVNKLKISDEEFELIFIANDECDRMVKETYNKYKNK